MIKFFLIHNFYNLINPLRKLYWFVFRPHVRGAKCVVSWQGKVLLVKITYAHRKWSVPGGKVKRHESFEEGAKREIKEEVGIILSDVKKIGEYVNTHEYKKDTVHCFHATVEDPYFKIDNLEIAEARWCDPHNLPEPHTDGTERIMKMLETM